MTELPPSSVGPESLKPPGIGGKEQEVLYGREYMERGAAIPIPGPDLIEDLQLAEIGEDGDISELEGAISRAMAFREGLPSGISGEAYNFDPEKISSERQDKQKLAYLVNLFTTVESSTRRPRAEYVEIAIDEAIEGRIRRAQAWREDPEAFKRKMARKLDAEAKARAAYGGEGLAEGQRNDAIRKAEERLGKEYAAIPKLVELGNHIHSRKIFDVVFTHRMYSCEDPGRAAKLGSSDFPTYTPDAGHWSALFRGEFGVKVDEVFEEMIKLGMEDSVAGELGLEPVPAEVRKQVPASVYATGFENATMFAVWLKHLLRKANGRMDVVWNAWKLMLTWEVADSLGEAINKDGKWILANPPIGNSLHTFTSHLDIKRRIEYGLKPNGERSQEERFVSHSGLPMSLGHIPNTCENYFVESSIKFDASYVDKPWMREIAGNLLKYLPKKKRSDYERADYVRQRYFDKLREDLPIWLEKKRGEVDEKGEKKLLVEKVEISLWDLRLYGRLKFSDDNFPWIGTEQESADVAPGELSPGSVGFWFLTRSRCWGERGGVVNDIRSMPPLQELGDPDFFVSRLRNWTKVLGKVERGSPSDENPRAWWLMGIIRFHMGGTHTSSPITKKEPGRDYRTLSRAQEISTKGEAAESRTVNLGDVLYNATNCGFIRDEDKAWIIQQLGIVLK